MLHSTNNFPEFTGRVCPAPCEAACTLNINDDPVGIKSIEHFIIDKGWEEGWVVPRPPDDEDRQARRRRRLRARRASRARSSSRAPGHDVVVFEKSDRIGGLLRYGIPDFKMEKPLDRPPHGADGGRGRRVPRRASHVGRDVDAEATRSTEFDAVVLAGGAEQPRDLPVPGRELDGVHFAMEFLPQQNKVVAGDRVPGQILATGKHVVVIGGGDTGSDCVGTSNRHGARVGHAVRAAAAAARAGEQAAGVAVLADQAAHARRRTRKAASATGRSRPSASRARRQGREADRRARRVAEGRRRPDEDGRGARTASSR